MIDPKQDGISHINIYSQGKTPLGKWLSNFAHEPIQTEEGVFASIEGYWYWLGIPPESRRFCISLHGDAGFQAKRNGDAYRARYGKYEDDDFEEKIKEALYLKLKANQKMARALWRSHPLPFEHYYVYGTVVRDAGYKWLLDIWTEFRDKLVEGWGDPNEVS